MHADMQTVVEKGKTKQVGMWVCKHCGKHFSQHNKLRVIVHNAGPDALIEGKRQIAACKQVRRTASWTHMH